MPCEAAGCELKTLGEIQVFHLGPVPLPSYAPALRSPGFGSVQVGLPVVPRAGPELQVIFRTQVSCLSRRHRAILDPGGRHREAIGSYRPPQLMRMLIALSPRPPPPLSPPESCPSPPPFPILPIGRAH